MRRPAPGVRPAVEEIVSERMISDSVITALIAAASAIGGAALANFSALLRQAQQDATQDNRAKIALLNQKREECLGYVLEARTRIESFILGPLNHESSSIPSDKTPGAAARQAYAVALLYLVAARPSAKAFYRSTTQLQLALAEPNWGAAEGVSDLVAAWRQDYEQLELCLSEMADSVI